MKRNIHNVIYLPLLLTKQGGGVTQNSDTDPFLVSDADTMVNYLKTAKK